MSDIERVQFDKRIALYGGAFDPPHQSHLYAITSLLLRSDLDEVWLLPTFEHAFKAEMTTFELRCDWLNTCITQLGWAGRVRICEIEKELGGVSRTFNTLSELATRFPDFAFSFVIGADNLAVADQWFRFDDLVARWPLIVFGRIGFEWALEKYRHSPWLVRELTLPQMSSTAIRADAGNASGEESLHVPEPIRGSVKAHFRASTVLHHEQSIVVLGEGRLGSSLINSLRRCQRSVLGWSRAKGDLGEWLAYAKISPNGIFIIAVSDSAINEVAEVLRSTLTRSQIVLHCAGSQKPVDLAADSARSGVMHPIRAVAHKNSPLEGTTWGVYGGEPATSAARGIIRYLDGVSVEIRAENQALYHAAMVIVGNFPILLLSEAQRLLSSLCNDHDAMRTALESLMTSAVENTKNRSFKEALTGPVARQDLTVIKAHLAALSAHPPTAEWYRIMSIRLARMADWKDGCVALEMAKQRTV